MPAKRLELYFRNFGSSRSGLRRANDHQCQSNDGPRGYNRSKGLSTAHHGPGVASGTAGGASIVRIASAANGADDIAQHFSYA
ncbi:MAG: hypothetical protein ACRD41_09935, partial [Candidatus Acidiferrales bacterium]